MRTTASQTGNDRVEILPVVDARQLDAFIRLPHRIYADDPAWVPPLHIERRMHLSPRHNPFFEHGEGQLFLALRRGEVVGRVSAHIDRLFNATHPDEPPTGFFGFIEAVDNAHVFAALLDAAQGWLRARGIVRMRGPFNWSINQESGLLVKGFDTPPAVMMGHARHWYDAHMHTAGMRKVMDLLAYDYTREMRAPEKFLTLAQRLKDKGDLHVRGLVKRELRAELDLIMDIFNDAWSANWGFVPFTAREIRQMGDELRWLVGEHDVAIATWKGEPAAFTVVIPDINRMIADFGGRLLPFNWAKLIWRLKFAGPPERMRMPLMGVRRKYQNSTIGAALALAVIDKVNTYHRDRGVQGAELSWILETNMRTRKLIESTGARHYKTYRIYEREIP